jgi:hypothetical protein
MAEACGRGHGAKKAVVLPIRLPSPETLGASSDRRPAHTPGDSIRLPGPEKLPSKRLECSMVDTQRFLVRSYSDRMLPMVASSDPAWCFV